MKTRLTPVKTIISCLFLIISLTVYSQTITISKSNSQDPDKICDKSEYNYTASLGGDLPSEYTVDWVPINGTEKGTSSTTAKIKWESTSAANGNIGKLTAKIMSNNNVIATSNTITLTIKSIKHLKPDDISPFAGYNQLTISPCNQGSYILETQKLVVPGTNNQQKIYDYAWTIPSGWSMNGTTSTGAEISGDSYNTVNYPASSTNGTIKVRGYGLINGCGSEMQYSKYSTAISVKRDVNIELTSNKNTYLCGDTAPITFTVNATPDIIPCAVYYWNNSTTGTTSNTFQIAPDGFNDLIVTVNVIYGGTSKSASKTIVVKSFEPPYPYIQGERVMCSGSNQYNISELRPGYTVSWAPSSNINEVSSSGNSAVFSPISNGTGYLNATITSPCGDNYTCPQKNLWIGEPDPNHFTMILQENYSNQVFPNGNGEFELCPNTYYSLYLSPVSQLENYGIYDAVIYLGANYNIIDEGSGYVHFYVDAVNYPHSGIVEIYAECGDNYEFKTMDFVEGNCGYYMMISPNPSTSETIISIESNNKNETLDKTKEWELEIYKPSRLLKEKKAKIKGNKLKIKTSGWKEGVYLVRANYNNKLIKGKLVVK